MNPGECPSNIGAVLECDDSTDCPGATRCCGQTLTEDGGVSDTLFVRAQCVLPDPDAGCGAFELCQVGTQCFRQGGCNPAETSWHPAVNICQ